MLSSTLYCSGLDSSITSADLIAAFACKAVELHAEKGFALLSFRSPHEASEALRFKTPRTVKGKPIYLFERSPNGSPNLPRTTLFIGGLNPAVDNFTLKETFNRFGTVVSARVGEGKLTNAAKNKGFAFCQMETEEMALAAIKGLHNTTELGFPTLRVTFSVPSVKGAAGSSSLSGTATPVTSLSTETTPASSPRIGAGVSATDFKDVSQAQHAISSSHAAATPKQVLAGLLSSNRQNSLQQNSPAPLAVSVTVGQDGKPKLEPIKTGSVGNHHNSNTSSPRKGGGLSTPSGGSSSSFHPRSSRVYSTTTTSTTRYEGSSSLNLNGNRSPLFPPPVGPVLIKPLYKACTPHKGLSTENGPSKTLYVRPFPDYIDEYELYDMFKPYGTVVATKILRNYDGYSRGSGFVEFSTREEAEHAFKETIGRPAMGTRFKVNWSDRPLHISVNMGYGGVNFAQQQQCTPPSTVDASEQIVIPPPPPPPRPQQGSASASRPSSQNKNTAMPASDAPAATFNTPQQQQQKPSTGGWMSPAAVPFFPGMPFYPGAYFHHPHHQAMMHHHQFYHPHHMAPPATAAAGAHRHPEGSAAVSVPPNHHSQQFYYPQQQFHYPPGMHHPSHFGGYPVVGMSGGGAMNAGPYPTAATPGVPVAMTSTKGGDSRGTKHKNQVKGSSAAGNNKGQAKSASGGDGGQQRKKGGQSGGGVQSPDTPEAGTKSTTPSETKAMLVHGMMKDEGKKDTISAVHQSPAVDSDPHPVSEEENSSTEAGPYKNALSQGQRAAKVITRKLNQASNKASPTTVASPTTSAETVVPLEVAGAQDTEADSSSKVDPDPESIGSVALCDQTNRLEAAV